MSLLGQLLGFQAKEDLAQLYTQGAQIIDVRTAGEFAGGHIKQSINIPLDKLESRMKEIKKDKPVIAVCASGMRSGSAVNTLKKHGYEAHNGGSWDRLNSKLG